MFCGRKEQADIIASHFLELCHRKLLDEPQEHIHFNNRFPIRRRHLWDDLKIGCTRMLP